MLSPSLQRLRERLLKDPEVKKEYERLRAEFEELDMKDTDRTYGMKPGDLGL